MSTLIEVVGFSVLAITAAAWSRFAGGAVAGFELLLIGYCLEGSTLDLRGRTLRTVLRLRVRAAQRKATKVAKAAAKAD